MIDVILLAWNQLKYTKICLESLSKYEDLHKIRLVLINNGSTDGTKEYFDYLNNAQSIGNSRCKINVIHNNENLGFPKGVNQGLKESLKIIDQLDAICLLNNDTEFTEPIFEKLYLEIKNGYGIVGPTSDYIMGPQKYAFAKKLSFKVLDDAPFIVGLCFMINPKVVKKIGLFDEIYGLGGAEELDYCIRAKQKGYKFKICKDTFIRHAGSKSIQVLTNGLGEEYQKYCDKHDKMLREKWGDDVVDNVLFKVFDEIALNFHVPNDVKVMWAIPMRDDEVHRRFMTSGTVMRKPGQWIIVDAPGGIIHDSRNMLVEYFLKTDYTHIFLTDNDMILPQNIAQNFLAYDLDIVSGYFHRRKGDYSPCIFRYCGKNNFEVMEFEEPCGLMNVDATGLAATMIKREVFEKIPFPWFMFEDEDGSLGEDLFFMKKAKKYGFKIWCDTNMEVDHLGPRLRVNRELRKLYKQGVKLPLETDDFIIQK